MQNVLSNKEANGVSNLGVSYSQEDWARGYESQRHEEDYWIDQVEGEIPGDLQGTWLRNGPGLLDINGYRVHHPFDGDGMICAIAFDRGRAHFRNRFVRTEGFLAEQKAGKPVYRGVFGTQKPGGWLANLFDVQLKNIANTNVIYWGGKLLALWEAAKPYSLDPHTLETLGEDNLDGVLPGGESFAAHPWIDPSSKLDGGQPCLVNFAIQPGLSTKITIYEFNLTGKLLRRQSYSVPGFAFIHDFAITPNYCIFFQNPVSYNPIPFLLGYRGAGECLAYQPEQPTRIILIPRKQNTEEVKILETQSGFIFHHANAFEEDGKIYVDSICYKSLSAVDVGSDFRKVDFNGNAPGQLWRFTLDLTEKTVGSKLIEERCCEFPTINPNHVGNPYRYLFIGAADHPTRNAPLQGILKIDMATKTQQFWSAAPKGFINEPMFVPRPNAEREDDGWVLTLVYDASHHRSDLVILDGCDLTSGPLARLHLKHHIPYGLHGSWTSELLGLGLNHG